MNKQLINERMLEIQKAISQNEEAIKFCNDQIKEIEKRKQQCVDSIILNHGALQDCAYWLEKIEGKPDAEIDSDKEYSLQEIKELIDTKTQEAPSV